MLSLFSEKLVLTEKIFTGGYLFEILYGVKYGIALHGNNGDIPVANMPRLLQVPLPF
jgi:hypothetical protein